MQTTGSPCGSGDDGQNLNEDEFILPDDFKSDDELPTTQCDALQGQRKCIRFTLLRCFINVTTGRVGFIARCLEYESK